MPTDANAGASTTMSADGSFHQVSTATDASRFRTGAVHEKKISVTHDAPPAKTPRGHRPGEQPGGADGDRYRRGVGEPPYGVGDFGQRPLPDPVPDPDPHRVRAGREVHRRRDVQRDRPHRVHADLVHHQHVRRLADHQDERAFTLRYQVGSGPFDAQNLSGAPVGRRVVRRRHAVAAAHLRPPRALCEEPSNCRTAGRAWPRTTSG
ncbi:hypothetical protein ACRAWF_18200 [Streptomyces sp. L7]